MFISVLLQVGPSQDTYQTRGKGYFSATRGIEADVVDLRRRDSSCTGSSIKRALKASAKFQIAKEEVQSLDTGGCYG